MIYVSASVVSLKKVTDFPNLQHIDLLQVVENLCCIWQIVWVHVNWTLERKGRIASWISHQKELRRNVTIGTIELSSSMIIVCDFADRISEELACWAKPSSVTNTFAILAPAIARWFVAIDTPVEHFSWWWGTNSLPKQPTRSFFQSHLILK